MHLSTCPNAHVNRVPATSQNPHPGDTTRPTACQRTGLMRCNCYQGGAALAAGAAGAAGRRQTLVVSLMPRPRPGVPPCGE